MIETDLKILVVEDSESDYKLLRRQIYKIVEQPAIVRVIYFEDFKKAFNTLQPDIIISDYKLVDCDGLEILEYTVSKDSGCTFIFITGTFENEAIAENTILSGADGYILKKHINTMSRLLLPYFKRAVFKKDTRTDFKKDISLSTGKFIENAKKENYLHSQSCKEIRNYLKSLENLH